MYAEQAAGAQRLVPQYGPCEQEALKTRMRRAVASLGRQEIEEIIEEQVYVVVGVVCSSHLCLVLVLTPTFGLFRRVRSR